jgi:transcriptional regulator with PAS, ATPase and Fis domain
MGWEAASSSEAIERRTLEDLAREGYGPFAESLGLVGRSPGLLALGERIRALARSHATVLVMGETGTGKELVARALHACSPREAGPFVPHNFGAITDTLVESELFGHARGSFTGAHADRMGLFEAAHQGTLFLDEIGDASPSVQSRLLRVIQEGELRRVGDSRSRHVDVRVVAATHRDLESEVLAGRFRADLFYRLHVLGLVVPPLRDRPEDVPLLAAYFLARLKRRDRVPVRGIREDALRVLTGHSWPGNIRELMGALERACHSLDREGWITRRSLGEGTARGGIALVRDRAADLKGRTLAYEAELIRRALASHGGNKAHAARSLGLTRQGLWKKMRRLKALGPDSP